MKDAWVDIYHSIWKIASMLKLPTENIGSSNAKIEFHKGGGNFVFKTACVQGMKQLQGQAIKNNMFEISRFKIASIMINPYESRLSFRINQLFLPFTNHTFWRSSVHHSTNGQKTFWDLLLDTASISQHTLRQHTLYLIQDIMKVYHLFTPASIALLCQFFRLVYEHV